MRLLFPILLILFGKISFAKADITERAQAILKEQIVLLEKIEPTVERLDLARVYVIKLRIKTVLDNIQNNIVQNVLPITPQTIKFMQFLIIQYKFSHVFLGWEETPSLLSIYNHLIKGELKALKKSYEEMLRVFGYDESPYITITAHIFRQMKNALEVIENQSIDKTVKTELRNLWPSIGRTIAIAEQGDRPCTFSQAVEVIFEIRKLYILLEGVASSDAGATAILEFQGLVEFYADFAQIDRLDQNELCQ